MLAHDPRIPKYKGPFSTDYRTMDYGNTKNEIRGRSRHQNNSKIVVRNMEERNTSSKRKSPKQGLTSAKDLTIMLPEGRDTPYHRLD